MRPRPGKAARLEADDALFDERNVWHTGTFEGGVWEHAPRLSEDDFGAVDAMVVGGMLISMIKHADRVQAACQAQLVNMLGMIRPEPGGPARRQATSYSFAQPARMPVARRCGWQ